MGSSFANILRAVLVLTGLSATVGFHTVASNRRPGYPPTTATALFSAQELSPVDEMCIENVAEYCLHESCDIEEYEALINQLEEQKLHFIKHTANVENLLIRLKDSNHPEHDPDDVKMLIDNIKDTLSNAPSTESINGLNA